MADRQFTCVPVTVGDDGARRSAAEVACSRCDATHRIITNTAATHLPAQVVAKKFAAAGWEIGSREGGDVCPSCRIKRRKPRPTLTIVPKDEPMTTTVSTPTIVPAPMGTTALKKQINQKLWEVYESDTQGYARGWSDKRVAEELDAPRALVASIREEFFGPARDNPDVRELLEKAEVVFAEAAALETRHSALAADVRKFLADVAQLKKDVELVKKAVVP